MSSAIRHPYGRHTARYTPHNNNNNNHHQFNTHECSMNNKNKKGNSELSSASGGYTLGQVGAHL